MARLIGYQDATSGPVVVAAGETVRHDVVVPVLAVIAPETRELLASRRSEEVLAAMCGAPWLYTIRETEAGDTRALILRAELASPAGAVGEGR